jgi:hypothetical protein
MEGGPYSNENCATAWSDPMKEIVLVTLAIDAETGKIDPRPRSR